ncbi:hypothetical protein ONE63_003390 [Megalurothrips usitatus]|uniref:Helitron helicase-like domain-containing protein n=1 Tax=Megalurothrips usitatus TaxID=439358 RepID=A0AAV7X764_9NEOP|nr:hypothetical protein ONE63_003390 [Megalurothrips usitatus]
MVTRSDSEFLYPDELPDVIHVGGRPVLLAGGVYEIPPGGQFPPRATLPAVEQAVGNLVERLQECFGSWPGHGFLFTGNTSTFSFWLTGDKYFLFNSHSVNQFNVFELDRQDRNVARLFSTGCIDTLALLLFANAPCDGNDRRYTLCAIRPVNEEPPPPLSDYGDDEYGFSDSDDDHGSSPEQGLDSSPCSSESEHSRPLASRVKPASVGRSGGPAKKRRGDSVEACDASRTSQELLPPAAKRPRGRPKKKPRGRRPAQGRDEADSEHSGGPSQSGPETGEDAVGWEGARGGRDRQTPSPSAAKGKRGRPAKKKRGRPKTSTLSRKEQQAEATRRYRERNRERAAAAHREAVASYQASHPEVNRASSATYQASHPEVNRASSATYQASHPEVNRASSAAYQATHPEERAGINQRYRAAHPESGKISYLSAEMRRGVRQDGPIAFWSGQALDRIAGHRLVKPSLLQPDIYRCEFCGAPLFEEEKHRKKWCCGGGAYVQDLPPLEAQFYESPVFLDRARAYNDVLAFCAMGISGGYRMLPGLSFFKIEGRMYHRIYSLGSRGQSFRTRGRQQQFINHCRLYIDDGAERLAISEGRGLSGVIVSAAQRYLENVSPFVRQFRVLGQEPSANARLDFEVTERRTHGPALGDRNRGVEVQAVINTDEAVAGGPRKLSVWRREDVAPTTIDVFSPLMEPLQYPLLYPHGTAGWHFNKLDRQGRKMTQYRYSRCLLLSHPRFYELGRLSQAWMVEMFARYEEERLRYIKRCQQGAAGNPQGQRVAPRDELQRQIGVRNDIAGDETINGEGGAVDAGKIYLPNSFTGSPRYMKTQYHNAMGLVARKGKPTYFLTFTACGQWDELRRSTRHGTKCDPATCCRIFHIKLQELLRDIRSGALFGPTAYVVYVIEMQMRGLPHAHIAIRTGDGGPVQGADIDSVIRADIPGPEEAGGRLRELVLKHMVHGPCGPGGRTDLPCWNARGLKCDKFYPKPESPVTFVDDRGFVHFRRDWNNKATYQSGARTVVVHDGWVVPYNAALLLKYECHANLEIASTRRVVKYLFKYLCKGTSLQFTSTSLQNVRVVPLHLQEDEVEEYATRRVKRVC